MNDENVNNTQENEAEEPAWEEFGWEFHKIPIIASAIMVALFYMFIFFWISL